jgi:FolB domain-containing protein
MSKITIVELEVFYHVGVSEQERAAAQRLLITADMTFDFTSAAVSDRIEKTINYHDVAQDVMKFGENRSWKLLEKLVSNLADMILARYRPQAVMVEAKKFAVPQARHVAVSLTRSRPR